MQENQGGVRKQKASPAISPQGAAGPIQLRHHQGPGHPTPLLWLALSAVGSLPLVRTAISPSRAEAQPGCRGVSFPVSHGLRPLTFELGWQHRFAGRGLRPAANRRTRSPKVSSSDPQSLAHRHRGRCDVFAVAWCKMGEADEQAAAEQRFTNLLSPPSSSLFRPQ
ncbi:hypothetical protein NDU88_003103 [Pleurodeles waltl]|uniref:Uncharacterized protein n=1 Tax=Pleurodeles waltl TaxID=8319 RepID=A0AAV7Q8R3_PLEWA|nr:hypothetical protein NDU88_003103 [Pleurodeles waltl]